MFGPGLQFERRPVGKLHGMATGGGHARDSGKCLKEFVLNLFSPLADFFTILNCKKGPTWSVHMPPFVFPLCSTLWAD